MREILFRGKSKLTGLFLDGNLLIDQDGETYIVWFNCHKKNVGHLYIQILSVSSLELKISTE